jgi:molybdate transport system ATP-binding protein
MTTNPGHREHLLKLAAIIYRSGQDDVDGLLAAFAVDLIREGYRVGGVIQHNAEGLSGPRDPMQLIDLSNGRAISICQSLGRGAVSCRLDAAGLAEASVAVSRAIAAEVDLVIVNKFSKVEAAGGGLRAEIADAVVAGLPLLTAVPDKCFHAWVAFTGGFGTTLACERRAAEEWWRETSWRQSHARVLDRLQRRSTPRALQPTLGVVPLRRFLLADHNVGRLDHG